MAVRRPDDAVPPPAGPVVDAPPRHPATTGRKHAAAQARRRATDDILPAVEAWVGQRDPVLILREVAAMGVLADVWARASARLQATLTGAAYAMVPPIVFVRVTRPLEKKRGHDICAGGPLRLAEACHDGHQDDVEAVIFDLMRHATVPIRDVEAWVSARAGTAVIEGNRLRRGRCGALQRPRIPIWLARQLHHDAWRLELAVWVLLWVAVPQTAGTELWPLTSWAQRRSVATGTRVEPAAVQRDVDTVLAAMRQRPQWYADYVERPLGHKQTPVAVLPAEGPDAIGPAPLMLVSSAEVADGYLADLAETALRAIAGNITRGEDPVRVVARVLRTVFGDAGDAYGIDRPPHDTPDTWPRVRALLSSPEELRRVTDVAVDIVAVPVLPPSRRRRSGTGARAELGRRVSAGTPARTAG